MQVSISFKPEITQEVEQYIKDVLPEVINKTLLEDPTQLNGIIRECVRGYIKGTITSLIQDKDYRSFLRDRIMEQIGMKDETNRYRKAVEEIEEVIQRNDWAVYPHLYKELLGIISKAKGEEND